MLKLATPEVVVEFADGSKRGYSAIAIQALYDCGRVAKLKRRKRDKAVCYVYALAMPGEIARPSHRTATVVHDLPNNYSHNMRACLSYGHLPASLV